MKELELFALIRSTLLTDFALEAGYSDVVVKQRYQARTVGVPDPPAIFLHIFGHKRFGVLGRHERQPPTPGADMIHEETQIWECTVQISGFVWRNPEAADFLTLPTSGDLVKMASNILQSDKGLAALAVQNVRPLRVTEFRNVTVINDRDEYEHNPSFDIVVTYPETRQSASPPVAQFEPNLRHV